MSAILNLTIDRPPKMMIEGKLRPINMPTAKNDEELVRCDRLTSHDSHSLTVIPVVSLS